MFSENNKISIRQLQILLILDVFGTGITILPRKVAAIAGVDGFICVIIATILMLILTYLMVKVTCIYPENNFVEVAINIMGRPIGIVICSLFVIKMTIHVGLELRIFGEIVRQHLLSTTPFFIICLSMLLLGMFIALKGYETRARVSEILIFVVVVPVLVVFGLALREFDIYSVTPILKTPPRDIAVGSFVAVSAFSSLEFLMIAVPYINKKKYVKKAESLLLSQEELAGHSEKTLELQSDKNVITENEIMKNNSEKKAEEKIAFINGTKLFSKSLEKGVFQVTALIGFCMTVITIITIARLGLTDTVRQLWPVLEIMDTVEIPGSFIARQGALVMSFWIVSMFAVVNAGIFFSSILLRDIFKGGKHFHYILFIVPIIFLISLLPRNVVETYAYSELVNNTFGFGFLFGVPILLFVTAKIRRFF